MSSTALYFRLRIRDATNSSDALVITSVRGGTNPWLSSVPQGDGQSINPLTGESMCAAYTGLIADGITSGTDRVLTSQLEDANYRQQLMDRRAFSEWSTDGSTWSGGVSGGVLIAGFLTQLRLANQAEYEYTVSDPTRQEHDFMAFKPQDGESIDDFVTRWPNRGCILGGPVRGGFLDQQDRGGWEMTVEKSSSTFLRFNAGYAPPDFERTTDAGDAMGAANEKAAPFIRQSWQETGGVATFDSVHEGRWQDLIVEIVGTGFFRPSDGTSYDATPSKRIASNDFFELCKASRDRGLYVMGTSGPPAAGTKVRVRVLTAHASEASPIYHTAHPVDWLAKLWDEAGLSYDAASLETVRDIIGADRRYTDRITEPKPLGAWLTKNIYGPFGIGVRPNDDGELEAFSTRVIYNDAPTTEITSADIWTDESGSLPEIFNITQASAIKTVAVEHHQFVKTQDARDDNTPDGYVLQSYRVERTNADTGAVGNRSIEFVVDGMIHSVDAKAQFSTLVDAFALEVFDRWGRGVITGEIAGLRGGSTDDLLLGMECINKIPPLPNHNKRLIDDNSVSGRAMQVTRRTWTPVGYHLQLTDSGPNAQPFATAPTLSMAASSSFPRTVAEVTVTNAATLNAASAGLRLQMAVTTGSAPASGDYTDVAAYDPGEILTGAIALPGVTAGRKVYTRAKATKAGSRPSSWSTPASVTLTALTDPSSLTATPSGSDGSICALAWTAGDTTSLVDVYLRESGASSSTKVLQRTLPEGSVKYTLEGLTPGNAYTASVQDRDAATGDVSALVDVTFTAGATTTTLNPPVYPFGFCGSRDPETGAPRRDGVFGIGVVAAAYPGEIEVAVATETAVGSGVYGAFETSGRRAPNVLGNWTTWEDVAPNDGLRRQVKARHVRDGATSSSYCTAQTVTPWTPQALPVYPTNIITSVVVNAPANDSDAQTKVSVTVSAVDPSGGSTKVALTSLTSNSSVLSGNAVGTYGSSPQTWSLARPGVLKGSAAAVFTGDDANVTGARASKSTVDVPEQGQQGAPVITLTPKDDGHVEVTLTGNNDTDHYTTAESTSSMPSDATARAGTSRSGRVVTFTSTATLSLGDRYYLKAVPYNAAGTEGQIASGTVDRQNKNTTGKRIAFSAVIIAEDTPSAYTYTRDPTGIYLLAGVGSGVFTGYGVMTLPDGITLTGIDSWTTRFTSSSAIAKYTFLRITRSSGATSTLATHTNSTTGSAQHITTTGLSEVIDNATYCYIAKLELDSAGSSGVGVIAVAGSDFGATYTSPDFTKSY